MANFAKHVKFVFRFTFCLCPMFQCRLRMTVFSPLNCLCSSLKDKLIVFVWLYFCLSFLLHSPINLFFFLYYITYITVDWSQIVSVLQLWNFVILWCLFGPFVFYIHFRISLWISIKQIPHILINSSIFPLVWFLEVKFISSPQSV